MQFEFSDRISTLQPSAIREILKATSQPGVIPFAAGNPAPEAFPTEEVREITEKLLTERPIDCLQYGVTEGYTPLRERISTYMKQKHNIGRDFDSLLITSGAQQVMDLATKALCNEGDTVICEAPSFIGGYPEFTPGDSTVEMRLMLDRPGTVYYVVAPMGTVLSLIHI